MGMAELESLFGADAVQPLGSQAALLDVLPAQVPFAFLGGTVKFCKVLTTLDTIKWSDIQKFLENAVPDHASSLPEGKLKLGLSVYGLSAGAKQLMATGLELKKALKVTGRSARLVPNQEPALSSAQVLHNQLTAKLGWELVFVSDGKRTVVAQTIAVQDIDAYTLRDRGRPKRDARVGMLPPKLAQTIINLATSKAIPPSCGPNDLIDKTILDPFCGTGVILQEALVMGYSAYGSDLDAKMIDYSSINIHWLRSKYSRMMGVLSLETGDATTHTWKDKYDYIASEVYLGRPFTSPPPDKILQETVQDAQTITKKFLQNLATQTKPGFRGCIAIPAWKTYNGFIHLPLLDNLKELGYNRVRFVHASQEDLIYHREGQIVARELVVLTRN